MADISLLGVQKDIAIVQGSSVRIEFELRDEANAVLDMTGWDLRLQVRPSYASTDRVINATLANEKLEWIDATLGKFAFVLAPTDTSSIRFPKDTPDVYECVYDMEVAAPVGNTHGTSKPWYGVFSIQREVTR